MLGLSYAFALSRQCLRILGIWPDPFMPLSDFRRPNIRFIIVTCILCLYVILPQLTNLIHVWGNVARMVENIASANFSFMALCKLVNTWYHGESKLSFQKYCINIFVMRDINEKICYLTLRLILHNNFTRIKMASPMRTTLNDMSCLIRKRSER